MLRIKIMVFLGLSVAFASPNLQLPDWQEEIQKDSSWYALKNQQTPGRIHQELFADWLKSKRSEKRKTSVNTLKDLMERVREIGLSGNPLYVVDSKVVPVFAKAVNDSNPEIQEMAFRILTKGVSRSSLAPHRSMILEQQGLDVNQSAVLLPLVVQNPRDRDSILITKPLEAVALRAELGDTAAERVILRRLFPDSLFLKDTLESVLLIPGQSLSEAKYYHLCNALENMGQSDGALSHQVLGNMAARAPYLKSGAVVESFSFKILQRYSRFFEEDTLVGRAIALIRSYKTERALKKIGWTPERFWVYADAEIFRNWGFHLKPYAENSVIIYRNFMIDPEDGRPPSIYLRRTPKGK